MEKNFELIYQRGPFGDETSIYKLQINKEGYTIHELIQDAVSRRNEWGQVEVLVGKERYILEYKWGNIVEDHIPAELRTAVIDKETATASGGWSRMDYIVSPVAEQQKAQGGRRDGCGRKPLAPEARRVPLCFSVSPEVRDMAQELARSGVKTGRLVEAFIRAAYASKICLGVQETICTAITGEYLRK